MYEKSELKRQNIMRNNSPKLLNGNLQELKQEYLDISKTLPENWISIYVDKFCHNLRGMSLINKYHRLHNIKKLIATPQPSELKNLHRILEMDKASAEKAKALEV